ncbi:hypothetical protein AMELA_G00194200 [Ameiurus melas]|uniref:Ig-like domain-containing protein n=1 Tax=Ameiurus melas TaxID=219545 RepID=A0A7J6A959_AMEME|nr:hypothetical protein AMELA_G00194200 [Ameiurus melas]
MMKILLIFTLSLISGPVGCVDVTGYSGGSVIIISNLYWSSVNRNYICKVENGKCTDIRSAQVLSVNISDVREADGGVYLCGAYHRINSVQYFSFFTEIQLHVTETTSMMTSATPTESSPDALEPSTVTIIISVCVCVALLLIGGFALMACKLRHKRRQGLTPSSNDNNQVPLADCVYEEINHTNHVSVSDTDIYMNASPPTNPDKEISSTVQPPQEQNLTYTTVSFQKNPDDAAVTYSKEESATEYATVQHHSRLE